MPTPEAQIAVEEAVREEVLTGRGNLSHDEKMSEEELRALREGKPKFQEAPIAIVSKMNEDNAKSFAATRHPFIDQANTVQLTDPLDLRGIQIESSVPASSAIVAQGSQTPYARGTGNSTDGPRAIPRKP